MKFQESTKTPSSVNALLISVKKAFQFIVYHLGVIKLSSLYTFKCLFAITHIISNPYFFANSKSLSSCAGTAITDQVP